MPQLDKVTFLSQFFWLCFFFISFYFGIVKFVLPKLSRILKYRKKTKNTSEIIQNSGLVKDVSQFDIIKPLSSEEVISPSSNQTSSSQQRELDSKNLIYKTSALSENFLKTNFLNFQRDLQQNISLLENTYYSQIHKKLRKFIYKDSLSENITRHSLLSVLPFLLKTQNRDDVQVLRASEKAEKFYISKIFKKIKKIKTLSRKNFKTN